MGNLRSLGPFYLCGDALGPCRYKREVDCVEYVEPISWKPGYAWVGYYDAQLYWDKAGPVKIYHRKNGTAYVQFEGKRYNIDENKLDKRQYITPIPIRKEQSSATT